MSRSYKKNPVCKDNVKGAKKSKRIVASRIRNIPVDDAIDGDLLIGKSNRYKYINKDTYDIHDYISRWTEEDARQYYRDIVKGNEHITYCRSLEDFLLEYPTEDSYIKKFWAKCNKRK